jgi:drug/metabolite transporter (DMT)-like permease
MIVHSAISAGTYLAAKRALQELGPIELALARFVLAAGIYAALVWRAGGGIERRDWGKLLLLGVLGVTVNQLLFLAGMRLTTPGHGALLYALAPVFVFLMARVRHGERATPAKVGGIALAFAGTAVVLLSRGMLSLGAGSPLLGDLSILLAVVAWSAFAVGGKRLAEKYGPTLGTGWVLLVGTLVYLPIGFGLGDLSRFRGLSAGAWVGVGYLVVMTNVVAWLLYSWALSRAEASRVAVWSNLQPVLTALLAWAMYGERLTAQFAAGGAMVLLGVLLTERG